MAFLRKQISDFRRDRRGAAAVEFAAGGLFLTFGLLNAIDMGSYEYKRMEVENAAQAAAQAAWLTCNDSSTMLPATQNCAGLDNAVDAAVQSTSLGTSVSVASGYPAEGYYCVNSAGTLQSVGSLSNKPTDCSSVGSAGVNPGDYLQIGVTYNYAPMFPGVSVMSAWGVTTISMTSWMRLG